MVVNTRAETWPCVSTVWRIWPSTRACALALCLKMNDDVINRMSEFLDTSDDTGMSRPCKGHGLETRACVWPSKNPCRFKMKNKSK